MHDLLVEHKAQPHDLIGFAEQHHLDVRSFTEDLRSHDGVTASRRMSRAPT